jgi:outer membrane protein TolC
MKTEMAARGVRSWTAVVLSGLLTLAAPLAAQSAGQGTQTAPPPTPPAAGQTLTTPQMPVTAPAGAAIDLTMDQAVSMAVEANLGLKSQRLNVDIAAEGIAGAEAAFKPTLTAQASSTSSTRLPTSFTDLTSGSISSASLNGQAGVSQFMPWLGGSYSASWSNGRSTTTQQQPVFNPQLTSSVTFGYTQPLWRGLRIDANRAALANTETTKQVADLDLQLNTIELQSSVQQAYLGLKAAMLELGVANENLNLAKQQLTESQSKVKVGISAQVDIIQAEVQVQQNQVSVIQAEGQVTASADQLRTMILDPARPDYWTVQFNPTDPMVVQAREIDIDAAVKAALANRLDVQEARRNLEIAHRSTRLADDLTKPLVNAFGQYSATSSGGTQFAYDGLTGNLASTTVKSLGSVLDQTFTGAFPSWAFGVNVGYPIGRSVAQANLAQQRLSEEQAQINLRNMELSVAATVRNAARNVKTNFEVMQASHAALDAAQKQLDAENRKKELGLSDSFTLLQKQQILTSARVQDIFAQVAYNSAILTFEQVQRVR